MVRLGMVLTVLLSVTSAAMAADGAVEIDAAAAAAGNVTPGDAPGLPVSITVPGSYVLTGSLSVPAAGTTAIVISANDVSIDLNGFSISGPASCAGSPASCSGTGAGIGISGTAAAGVSIRNGAIRGMGSDGIRIGSAAVVEEIRASGNGGSGVVVGVGSMLRHNTATGNGATGLTMGSASIATDNVARSNGSHGIAGSAFSGQLVFRKNVASSNGGFGLAGTGAQTGDVMFGENLLSGNNGGNANPQVLLFSQFGIVLDLGNNLCSKPPFNRDPSC